MQPLPEEAATPAEKGRRSPWMTALRTVAVAAVAGVLALLVWATLAASRGQSFVGKIAAGKRPQAPAFDLSVLWPHTETWPRSLVPAIGGGKLALSELRGHPVVLNFWASWCIPCREEAPILRAGALHHRGQVVFLGIDVQDLTGDGRAFARKYRINYVSLGDNSDNAYNAYGLTGVPETYFIDAHGRAVVHVIGVVSAATLAQGVAAITHPGGTSGTLNGGAHIGP